MSWLQVHLDVADDDVAAAEAALTALGALSVTFGDAGDDPVLEPAPGSVPLWRRTRVSGLFAADADPQTLRSGLSERLPADIAAAARFEPLADQPWERAWLEHFRPMAFGDRLWIVPGDAPPPNPDAIVLRLDPGLAFGTGAHPTTALCLEWLAAHPPERRVVVDFGCGSGVLAVAAALLGARRVWALDIEPQALIATRANAERNGVGDRVQTLPPDAAPDGDADVVLANILANVLVDLAPTLGGWTKASGILVMSGLLQHQAASVMRAYHHQFSFAPPSTRADWALLVGHDRR